VKRTCNDEWSSRKAAWLIGAVLLGLPPLLLAPAWRLWGLSALEDGLLYYLPQRVWFARTIRAGEWPLWQHLTYGGFPVFADPQMAMYYPSTWLFVILPASWAYPLSVWLHHGLAGWFMYRFCRVLGRTRSAAVMGGVLYTLCGFMLAHREHLTMHHAAAWVPGILWAWSRWIASKRPGHWAIATAFVAMQLLAGHAQVSLMTAPLVLAWIVWMDPRGWRTWVWTLAGFVLAGMICSVQILPALQLLAHSTDRRDYNAVAWNSLAWRSLSILLFPMLFGQRTPNFYPVPWFGPSHQCEQTAYATVLGLCLALGGALLGWRRDRQIRFWGWAVAAALVLALGRNAGVYALFMLIPLFNVLHTPARWLIVVQVGLAVLAASGADALVNAKEKTSLNQRVWQRWLPLAVGIASGAILLWFAVAEFTRPGRSVGPANPAIWLPLVLLGTALGVLVGLNRLPARSRHLLLNGLVVADLCTVAPFLDVSTDEVDSITRSAAGEVLRATGVRDRSERVWIVPGDPYHRPRECMMPATNLLDGIATLNGYGPMLPREHRELMRFEPWSITDEVRDWLARPGILARLGVAYVVVRDPNIPHEDVLRHWEPVGQRGEDVRVYRNRHHTVPWYTAHSYRWFPARPDAMAAIRRESAQYYPGLPVFLEGPRPPSQVVGPGQIDRVRVRCNSAEFDVRSDSGTLLVWLNRWYPGWTARVDGQPAEIWRADVMGQAVLVPAGRHRVVFEFQPMVLTWSLGLSAVGVAATVLFTVIGITTPHFSPGVWRKGRSSRHDVFAHNAAREQGGAT